jgi:hypothetical protein
MKTKLIFDIETDGLIPEVSKIWCLVYQNVETKAIHAYSYYDDELPSLAKGLEKL